LDHLHVDSWAWNCTFWRWGCLFVHIMCILNFDIICCRYLKKYSFIVRCYLMKYFD
jgi:hypothetical protein